jgi:hypothetical protein
MQGVIPTALETRLGVFEGRMDQHFETLEAKTDARFDILEIKLDSAVSRLSWMLCITIGLSLMASGVPCNPLQRKWGCCTWRAWQWRSCSLISMTGWRWGRDCQ